MQSGSLARARTNTRRYAVNEHNLKTTVYICSLDFRDRLPGNKYIPILHMITANKGACGVYVVYIHDHAQFD